MESSYRMPRSLGSFRQTRRFPDPVVTGGLLREFLQPRGNPLVVGSLLGAFAPNPPELTTSDPTGARPSAQASAGSASAGVWDAEGHVVDRARQTIDEHFAGPYGPSEESLASFVRTPSALLNGVNRMVLQGGGAALDLMGRAATAPFVAVAAGGGQTIRELEGGQSSGNASRFERDLRTLGEIVPLLLGSAAGAGGVPRVPRQKPQTRGAASVDVRREIAQPLRVSSADASAAATLIVDRSQNSTRHGSPRNPRREWRRLIELWDQGGYGEILSDANRARIAQGRSPVVDETWVKYFPEDRGLLDQIIEIHHIGGEWMTVPLPWRRHYDAHMPRGTKVNPGGPGSATLFYFGPPERKR